MGGDDYPSLIRKTEPKPLRIWLQDGENDIENQFGSWWHSNLQMERALNFMGYDLMWQPGKGFHSNQHGEATLPTALRWLWRDVR
jgi:enterochelin esterase family protein